MFRSLLVLMLLATTPLAALAAQQGDLRPSHLIAAARAQVGVTTTYDAAYVVLDFPGGDVPANRGVDTDVVVRALRAGWGIDLQLAVNRDMTDDFAAYPAHVAQSAPDANIDHRRTANVATLLARVGAEVALSPDPTPWLPGDIVTWTLPGDLPHIGIVSDRLGAGGAPLVMHNIGDGTTEDDSLFLFPITGHYRIDTHAAERLRTLGT